MALGRVNSGSICIKRVYVSLYLRSLYLTLQTSVVRLEGMSIIQKDTDGVNTCLVFTCGESCSNAYSFICL